MKKIITIIVFGVTLMSCGSKIKYINQTNATEMREPFKAKDFQDNNNEFYSIRNSVGTNLNVIKAEALAAAQAEFSQRISVALQSAANLKLANSNQISSSNFNLKLDAIGNSSVKRIKIVDSKIFTRNNNNNNLITYDYWCVYKVDLNEVIDLANKSDLGFKIDNDDF
jgi:hypothetical protein